MTRKKPSENIVTARKYFDERSIKELSEWVRVGIEHYILQQGSLAGFTPIQQYFNSDLPISEGLAFIYAEVNAEGRSKLRNALALALDYLPVNEETAPFIKELLYAARRLPAPEIFSFLPKKIKSISSGLQADSHIDGRTLFEVAFQVVVDMPVADSLDVLNELIGSRNFDDSLSLLALDALCRVDPRHFPDHFNKLRDRIGRMFERYNTPPRMKRLLAKHILTSIGLKLFGQHHARLRIGAGYRSATDNWFYECLFEGPDKILTLSPTSNDIAWTDQNAKSWFPLISDKSEIVSRISRSGISQIDDEESTEEETNRVTSIVATFVRRFGDQNELETRNGY
jgi:hypothetical protein